jgi:hypothetical protein
VPANNLLKGTFSGFHVGWEVVLGGYIKGFNKSDLAWEVKVSLTYVFVHFLKFQKPMLTHILWYRSYWFLWVQVLRKMLQCQTQHPPPPLLQEGQTSESHSQSMSIAYWLMN